VSSTKGTSGARGRDAVMDHEYDGIQEYDNPTPGWWHLLFLATIGFSLVYGAFFHLSPYAWTPQTLLAERKVEEDKKMFAELGELEQDQATILRMMGNPKWMGMAQGMFGGNCANCHGSRGEGLVGVNLTDDHYKNVKKLEDFVAVINNGAGNGGMPSWKNRLHPNEVVLLAAYTASLRGTNVTGGRAAEGEVLPPWPKPPAEPAAPVDAGKGE
jgi:cytochrome c oxidase cbb3-type subunit III